MTLRVTRYTTMAAAPPNTPRTGPSRDMFGGPLLGVAVFVVVAIGLGWGLISILNAQLDHTARSLSTGALEHGFDPDAVYTLKRDLLLGYTANGTRTLFPARADLPAHAYGRRSMPDVDEVRAMSAEALQSRDLIGVIERNTRVRFDEVIDDRDNPQTRVLVMVVLLDGPHAGPTPLLGMHLESADSEGEDGAKRYLPRDDLFEKINPAPGPVQSPVHEQPPRPQDDT